MDYDVSFTDNSNYGRYQKLILWFVLVPIQFPYTCHLYSQLFMSLTPDHWCRVTLLDNFNVSEQFSRHLFVPKKDNVLHSLEYEKCLAYEVDYEQLIAQGQRVGWIPNQTWPVNRCHNGWVFNRTHLGPDQTIVTQWDLVCQRSFMSSLALLLFFSGGFFGQIIFTFLSNKFGLRKTYFAVSSLLCFFGILTGFSNAFHTFCILRFLTGVTLPIIASVPKALSIELIPQSKRNQLVILNEISHFTGALLLLIVSYLIRDFRHLTIAISFPFLLFNIFWWVLPESKSYLLCHQRIDQLDELMRRTAKINGQLISPDFRLTLRRRIRIECAIRYDLEANQNTDPSSFTKLFLTRSLRRKISFLSAIWTLNVTSNVGLTYYVMSFSNGNGNVYIPFFIAIISSFFGKIVSYFTMKSCGRKCTIGIVNLLSCIFCVLSAISKNKDETLSLVYFASAKSFLSISSGTIFVWTIELIPDATIFPAINFCDSMATLGLATVPLILFYGKKIEVISIDYLLFKLSTSLTIFAVLSLISCLFTLTLPEALDHLEKKSEKSKHCWQNWCCLRVHKYAEVQYFEQEKQVNGILKNKGTQLQSPILSLLRKQQFLRQNELYVQEKVDDLIDSQNKISTIKVTVL